MPPTSRRRPRVRSVRPAARGAAALLAFTALLALAGCGGELSTPGESLRLLGGGLPPAFLGQRYDAPVETSGGLRPFRYEIVAGRLPPGLDLASGVIAGVPTEIGEFSFTVEVADANLSSTVQEYTLSVSEVPPPELLLEVPPTAVLGPTVVTVAARGSELRGVRTVLRWDPARLRLVDDSVRATRRDLAVLFDAAEGSLQLDAALLGAAADGDVRLARFELEPTPEALAAAEAAAAEDAGAERGVRVGVSATSEFRARGGHSFARTSAGDAGGIPGDGTDPGPGDDPDGEDPFEDDPFEDDPDDEDPFEDDPDDEDPFEDDPSRDDPGGIGTGAT